jgi:N-acetylmuramoyl-L-alanine amidase
MGASMLKHVLAIAIALPIAGPAAAAPPVRTLYQQAVDKDQTVRAAWTAQAPPAAALKSTRRAIATYEAVVKHYPTSAYCDNALWQGGRLALDAFAKFGDVRDRETGVRLLRLLAAEYPASKLSKQVPGALASLSAEAARPAAVARTVPLSQRTPDAPPGAPRSVAAADSPAGAGHAIDLAAEARSEPKPEPRVERGAGPAAARTKQATITRIQRAVLPDVVRITIALDAEVPFHEERIVGPSRIFIDFPATRPIPSLVDRTLRFDEDSDIVRQVRIGRHSNLLSRVVLDATSVASYSVYPLYNPYRLVIDCVRSSPSPQSASANTTSPERVTPNPADRSLKDARPAGEGRLPKSDPVTPPSARAKTVAPASPAAAVVKAPASIAPPLPPVLSRRIILTPWGRTLPSMRPRNANALDAAYDKTLASRSTASPLGTRLPNKRPASTAIIADALASPPAESTAVAATAVPPAVTPPPVPSIGPAPNPFAGFSMARQLGLGVSRIVIDPGHGGHDPGAKGKGGVTEAELVLDVSLRLQQLLEKVKGVEVILTRRTDDFVALPERTAIANREGADLFLSIHANASPNDQARGVETYFLNFANNLSAASVAARENAASGQAMGALPDFVKAIALNNKLDESHDFAALVQESMIERLRISNKAVKDLGVKQAPFVVLIGASMPSVLAEISFITHEQEAKLLKSSAYRQYIAEALSLKRIQTASVE